MTTPARLVPVYDGNGVLLIEKAMLAYQCGGCRGQRLALARHASRWHCACGWIHEFTITSAEWKALIEEAKQFDVGPWRYVRPRFARERA